MPTISVLAQMCSNVYDGTPGSSQDTGPSSPLLAGGLSSSNWVVFENSNTENSSFWAGGYFGVAYYNTVTGEVVIANRGTDLADGVTTAFQNLASDAQLGLSNDATVVQTDAVTFAEQVISALQLQEKTYTSVIETGHSLGGNE